VQVRIIEQEMLGALPTDEELVPGQSYAISFLWNGSVGCGSTPAEQSELGLECFWEANWIK
jgi:hypothetical protein